MNIRVIYASAVGVLLALLGYTAITGGKPPQDAYVWLAVLGSLCGVLTVVACVPAAKWLGKELLRLTLYVDAEPLPVAAPEPARNRGACVDCRHFDSYPYVSGGLCTHPNIAVYDPPDVVTKEVRVHALDAAIARDAKPRRPYRRKSARHRGAGKCGINGKFFEHPLEDATVV